MMTMCRLKAEPRGNFLIRSPLTHSSPAFQPATGPSATVHRTRAYPNAKTVETPTATTVREDHSESWKVENEEIRFIKVEGGIENWTQFYVCGILLPSIVCRK